MGGGLLLIGGRGFWKGFSVPKGGGETVEEASALKKCFQPGPRPARDAFDRGGGG